MSDAAECVFVGPEGGPFTPESCDFQVVNSTSSPIDVNARFSVLYNPPWLEALVNGDPEPLSQLSLLPLTVPANGSLPFTLRLTDAVDQVTDPNNEGRFGSIDFADPEIPQTVIGAAGFLQFVESNDDFAGAKRFNTIVGSVSGTNEGATKQPGEPNHAGNAGGASLWWRYEAPSGAEGQVRFTTDLSSIDTLLAVYTGTSLSDLTLIAANDNESTGSTSSALSFTVTPGETYFIALDGAARGGSPGETGFYHLVLTEELRIGNDDFADAISLSGLAGSTTQFVSGRTTSSREPDEPAHGGGFGGSVWFSWVAPATGVYRLSAGGTGPGEFPTIGVYLGETVDQLIEVASTTILATATNQLSFLATAGGHYRIALADSGQSSSYAVSWELLNPQPVTGLFASILPSSRAVGSGQLASVFANTLNSSGVTGLNCRPEPPNHLQQFTPTGFDYQTTNELNLLVGTPNSPVDIPPGGVQNWLLQMNSPSIITSGRVGVRFVCDNIVAAPVFPDANGWLLRVLFFEPADVIAVGLSTGVPGIVDVPLSGSAAFAVAGVNIGPDSQILVRPEVSGTAGLTLAVCETDSGGICLAPPTATLNIPSFVQNQVRTFSVFATSGGRAIAFDPGFTRVFLRFLQGVNDVGATSLAVRTAE